MGSSVLGLPIFFMRIILFKELHKGWVTPEWVTGLLLITVSLAFTSAFIHPFVTVKQIVLRLGLVFLLPFIPISLKTIKWHRIDGLLFAWFMWQGLSTLFSTPWPQSGFKLEGLVLIALFYLLTRTALRKRTYINTIIQIIAVVAIIQSSIGILQYFKLFPWTAGFFQGYESQVTGTIGGANNLGALLALSLPFIYFLISKSHKTEKAGWVAALILIVVTLILTRSRGAWVAALVGIGIYKWGFISEFLRILMPGKVWAPVFALVTTGIFTLFLLSIYNLNPDSANGRLFIWSVTWGIITDHLWTGVGFGNFGLNWLEYQGAYFVRTADPSLHHLAVSLASAHSQYLNISAETGIMGLGLFIALCLSIFTSFKRHIGKLPAEQAHIFITVFSALVTILIHALVEDVFNSLSVQLAFLILLATLASTPDFNAERSVGGPVWNRKWKPVVILPLIIFLLTLSWRQIHGELLWKQGQDLARIGNWEQSIKHYQKAGSYLPYNHELDFYLGAAYSKTGQAEKAIKYLTQSQNGFSDKNQYIALGKAYMDNGQYELAEAVLNKVLYYYPTLLSPHYWLSRVYYEQGDIEGAREELETILSTENILKSTEIEKVKEDAELTLIRLDNIELSGK